MPPPSSKSSQQQQQQQQQGGDDTDSETELVMAEQEDHDKNNENTDDVDMSTDESDADASETRRRQALDQMTRIEKEFAELKDRLYQERMAGLKKEIEQIINGSHSEFIDHVHALEKKKAEKLRVAELWHNYQIECIENYFKAEKEAADHDFTNERQSIREQMLASLQDKLKRLEEEKNSTDITSELSYDSANRPAATRKLRRRGQEQVDTKATKKRVVNGPQINYALKEAEVLEDLYMIRKAFPQQSRRAAGRSNPNGNP